jgi:hypothetical protein
VAHHCSVCGQRQSDWRDDDGKVFRDPPFEVVEMRCPGCEALGYHNEETKEEEQSGPRYGIHLAFKRVSGEVEEGGRGAWP